QTPPPRNTPTATTTPARVEYIVQPNDTLGGIAQQFGISAEALMQANNISNANLLRTGQSLVIPLPTPTAPPPPTATRDPALPTITPTPTAVVYIVQSGDTLSGIAVRYQLPVDDIMAANGLKDPLIRAGQSLVIPPPTPTPTITPTPLPTVTGPVPGDPAADAHADHHADASAHRHSNTETRFRRALALISPERGGDERRRCAGAKLAGGWRVVCRSVLRAAPAGSGGNGKERKRLAEDAFIPAVVRLARCPHRVGCDRGAGDADQPRWQPRQHDTKPIQPGAAVPLAVISAARRRLAGPARASAGACAPARRARAFSCGCSAG
ncbi:MAG: LysM peptidoglycan-binding domain-containing protein, partial [Chloroflexi bacterium]|nr:LysM peptidoglycan-binding domain-containing protein [Chloroflexota bacterium]